MNIAQSIPIRIIIGKIYRASKPLKTKLLKHHNHACTLKIFLSSYIIFFSVCIGIAQPLPPMNPDANPVPFHGMVFVALLVSSLLLVPGRKKRTKPRN